jgi:hypothetical protein
VPARVLGFLEPSHVRVSYSSVDLPGEGAMPQNWTSAALG